MSDKKKQARFEMIKKLAKEKSEIPSLGDKLKGKKLSKVEVVAKDEKGLEKGLSLAKQIMKAKLGKKAEESEEESEESCEGCEEGCEHCIESEDSEAEEIE